MRTRRLGTLLTGLLVIPALVALLASAAGAHVDAEATQAADGTSTINFTFRHGCSGAPTTLLRVELPSGTTNVQPQNPTGWTSAADGTELQWTGGSVPDGEVATFTAVMRVPGAAGETVFLPTLQGCPAGAEEAWIDESDDPEAENAAPRIVLTVDVAAPSTTTTSTTTVPSSPTTAELASSQSGDSDGTHIALIALIVAIIAVVVVIVVVALRYLGSRTKPSA